MEGTIIRCKLHQYIDESDDRLLKLMYALAREYKGEAEGDVSDKFTASDLQRYEARQQSRLTGECKVHNWPEAKGIITGRQTGCEL